MISRNEIDELLSKTGNLNITITLPTHKKGEEVQQDPIRFKNLLAKIENELNGKGLKDNEIESFLKKPKTLLDDLAFWNHAEEGLAVYINEHTYELFAVPYPLTEQAYVNDHFLITPLLPMISLDGTFNILALNQKKLRLLHCNRKSVRDVTPDDIFTSIEDFLEEAPQAHLQFHTGAASNEAMFFGHGGNAEDRKEVALKYLRGVEESVTKQLKKYNEPLILAGTEEVVTLYRSINNYKRTVDKTVKGFHTETKDKELQEAGWEIIQDFFLKDMYNAIRQFKDTSSDRISNNLSEIIESTVMGKTDTLFISKNEESWGFYDDKEHTVNYTTEPNGKDKELLNWTALKALDRGAKVYVLPKEEMPHQSTIAALFRF